MTLPPFEHHGFILQKQLFDVADCERINAVVDQAKAHPIPLRSLLDFPWCQRLADDIRQHELMRELLPPDYVAVQCSLFEKSAASNWLVAVHQDLSIPVASREENPALHGWSQKDDVWFVQAPWNVLQELVAVRLHLDPCGVEDGALRLVPGSHRLGKIAACDASRVRHELGEITCAAASGDVLLLRPAILHASSKATGNSRRRVLHFLFGPPKLPLNLRWRWTV